MKLSESEKNELLTNFFEQKLLPFAKLSKDEGRSIFPYSTGENIESYYQERKDSDSYVYELDASDLAGEIARLWLSLEIPELAKIADDLIELAEKIRDGEESSGDVSPFVYAMF